MEKQRKIVSYEKLAPELQEHIMSMNYNDYKDKVVPVKIPNKETFYALMLETDEAIYLVKGDWLRRSVPVDTGADSALNEGDEDSDDGESKSEKEPEFEDVGANDLADDDQDDDY